ncbi:MAG: hypothetical protein RMJ38_03865 [candidate division WOR-3 bacterium]|nr:hypothetical protein [candidate division WOR-3 bacterium]MDW8150557.1 hypothetical protein [candidate division WOR-3 bacterium]
MLIFINVFIPWEFREFEEIEKPVEFFPPESLERRAILKGEWSNVGDVFYSNSTSSYSWQFLGPSHIEDGSWSDGIANSGRMSFILPHPTNPNIIYVATAGGGVWKTTDQGNTWIPLTDNLPVLTSGALAFDPTNPDIIYYGTGELHYCGVCFPGDGLFRSNDGGNTWTKIATTAQVGSYISEIVIHPNTGRIIVASDLGISYSDNNGNTWVPSFTLDDVNDIDYRSDNPNTIFIATLSKGVFKSIDGGNTWNSVSGLPNSGYFRAHLAISKSNPNIIYVAFGSTNYNLHSFWKSTDGGNTWTQMSSVPNYLCGQGFYNHSIIVHPTNPNIVLAGGVHNYGSGCNYGIIRTTNGGNSWSEVAGNVVHPDIHHFAYGPDGTLYVACDGGIWKSTNNGTSWININKGLGTLQFYTVGVKFNDEWVIVGGTQDNGTPILYNLPVWREVSGGDGGPTVFELQNPNYFWTTYIRMWYLTKYQLTSSYPNPSWNYLFYTHPWYNSGDRADWANGPIDVHQNGTIIVGTYRIWRSTNGGSSWTAISGSLAGNNGVLLSAVFSRTNSDTIYTGSSQGHFYMTHNGGNTWNNLTNNLSAGGPIRDIVINPNDSRKLYICIGNTSGKKVVYSANAGQSFTDITGNLPNGRSCRALAVDFQRNLVFVGMEDGVYYSNNNGLSYQKLIGLPNVYVFEMKMVSGKLIVATHGRSMWKLDIATDIKADMPNQKFDYRIKGNILEFSEELYYKIYNVDGRLYKFGKSKKVFLDKGMYILRVGDKNYKIVMH